MYEENNSDLKVISAAETAFAWLVMKTAVGTQYNACWVASPQDIAILKSFLWGVDVSQSDRS